MADFVTMYGEHGSALGGALEVGAPEVGALEVGALDVAFGSGDTPAFDAGVDGVHCTSDPASTLPRISINDVCMAAPEDVRFDRMLIRGA